MLAIAGHAVSIPGLVALGVVVGFLAGMFGVGGGFLMTPLLTVLFGVPMPIAVGTGLCQMVGTSTSALLRHRHVGQGEVRFDVAMLGGTVLGVDAGARALTLLARAGTITVHSHAIPFVTFVLELSYAGLLLSVAALFWRQSTTSRADADALEYVRGGPLARLHLGPGIDLPNVPLRNVSAIAIAQIGLALGFLSGLLGIGGGVALMPVLIYGFGFPIRHAAGTGILVLIVTAAQGTIEHALRGNVDLRLALVLLVGATLAAQAGAHATRRLPARTLRRMFSLVVLTTVVAIGWDLARRVV